MVSEALKKLSCRWNNDFYVSHRYPNQKWARWRKLSQWDLKVEPNYREILPSELVMETDLTREENEAIAKQINASLKEKDIGFYCSFTGNKSYHIHSFWSGLSELGDYQRTRAKELLVEWIAGKELASKIDKSNLGKKHLILIHGAKHYKTGEPKTLYDSNKPEKVNDVPKEIIVEALNVLEPKFSTIASFMPSKCPFLDYALKNKLPEGDRNNKLFPNAAAVFSSEQIAQLEQIQNENVGWKGKNPSFNCSQLRKYAESVGKADICTAHLLEALK